MNGLWMRLILDSLLLIAGITVLILCFKILKLWERIVFMIIIACLFIFTVPSSLLPAINPKPETVNARYVEEYREKMKGTVYVFDDGKQKYYLYLDSLSKRKTYPKEFSEDKKYTVTYETKTDIILEISEDN